MDVLYNASFVDFIKSERNCDFNGRHLANMVKDYKLEQVIHGLKWLVEGWSIEATARLLKNVFDDWLPELAAIAIAQIGLNWPLRPKMGLIVAFMMMGESANVAALFIRSLTIGWEASLITELISCLDTVLEWEDEYFTKFTKFLLAEFEEAKKAGEVTNIDSSTIVAALASMYKTTATLTNHRILMADLRLAFAKSLYLTQFSHSLTCTSCRSNANCSFRVQTPSPTAVIATARPHNPRNNCGSARLSARSNLTSLVDRLPPGLRAFFDDASSEQSETSGTHESQAPLYFNTGSCPSFTDTLEDDDIDIDDDLNLLVNDVESSLNFTRHDSTSSDSLDSRGETCDRDTCGASRAPLVVPHAVFETHETDIDAFRCTSSMMSLTLSSLDLGVDVAIEESDILRADRENLVLSEHLPSASGSLLMQSRGTTANVFTIGVARLGSANLQNVVSAGIQRQNSAASTKSVD
ncbi:hypothetical protein HDU83_006856 [Entophlyctis luteolus]|nr:hypothetical protein HDU83_006856 [Entophlyctis luteolus]